MKHTVRESGSSMSDAEKRRQEIRADIVRASRAEMTTAQKWLMVGSAILLALLAILLGGCVSHGSGNTTIAGKIDPPPYKAGEQAVVTTEKTYTYDAAGRILSSKDETKKTGLAVAEGIIHHKANVAAKVGVANQNQPRQPGWLERFLYTPSYPYGYYGGGYDGGIGYGGSGGGGIGGAVVATSSAGNGTGTVVVTTPNVGGNGIGGGITTAPSPSLPQQQPIGNGTGTGAVGGFTITR